MVFQEPPNISKNAINKKGDILIDPQSSHKEIETAREVLNQWRACHAYPINTFQATLRTKVRGDAFGKNPIIAQRLKRAPTIINKLKEGVNFGIQLSNMQDIAGIRTILSSMADVRKLEKEYREKKRFDHILVRDKDYIQNPKERDGYRSIHLIYKYKNKNYPAWDNLSVELQIRTKLQHSWATAVEAIHTFLDKALKTRQGQESDQQWTEFFRLVSSAFAYIEGTPPVSVHSHMSPQDILSAIIKYEKELKVIEKLDAFNVAMGLIKKGHFHLIVLDVKKHSVEVTSFGRDDFEEANKQYSLKEVEAENNNDIESVLVSSNEVEKAYPSFFADTKDFKENLKYVISGEWIGK